MDERHVREQGRLPIHRAVNHNLPRSVGQVVITTDHMRDGHVVVIHHDRKHVSRIAVCAEQHEIIYLSCKDADRTLDQVVIDDFALVGRSMIGRRAQPNNKRSVLARRRCAIAMLRTRSIWYGWFVHAATALTLECLVVAIEGGIRS